MIKKITAYILSICVMCTCVINFTVTASAAAYGEYIDGWYHISTAEQLKALADESQNVGSPVLTSKFVLDNDIELSPTYDKEIYISSDSKVPFSGIFDGNGHKISGLSYSSQAVDTSLFGFTDGATIKNLVIDRATIYGINRGGIVAGHAVDTDFLNISIKNSYLNIGSGGEVIELITADGVTAGALAGEAVEGCRIYNCETVNTTVTSGVLEGIAAAAGDGYYIGGLVGTLDNSHIEYSRVLTTGAVDSGKVELNGTVVLSVAAFKSIYIGGIVGEMKNSATVTDSYCNVYLNAWPTMGLGLIAATYGYLGGIAGAVYGENCAITRCHYSGKAQERSYQSGLLFATPMETNDHLGGIVGKTDNDYYNSADTMYINNYYNQERMMNDKSSENSSAVAWRSPSASIYYEVSPANCTSYTENQYADQMNWSNNGFDFMGSIERSTACDDLVGGSHANQWVMETITYNTTEGSTYTTTMPVHGTTSFTVYSNISNAFEDSYVSDMKYTYVINSDDTITVPTAEELSEIKPDLKNSGFIGIAFVSMRTGEGDTTIYTCDGIVEGGTKVPSDVVLAYEDSSDKAIYGVWCQAYTLGAQIGLNGGNQGLRVLTAVNTDLLDNIGLSEADVDYGRGATFTVDGEEYIIEAGSKEWRGESYITDGSYNGSKISDYVSNPKVFSIFLALEDGELDKEITYGGDILYNAADSDGTKVVLDYLCNLMVNSAGNIAEAYIADLEKSGETADNYYGIGEDAYNNLMEYIA